MSYGIPKKDTPENLALSLRRFLDHPERSGLTVREHLQYLAHFLEYGGGWIAVSVEEAIVRNHYDYLGACDEPKSRAVELFQHERLLQNLGYVPGSRQLSRIEVDAVVKRLVEVEILRMTTIEFTATMVTDDSWTVHEAVHELRKRLNTKSI